MRIVWSERASERIEAIETFIARDDPLAAERLVVKLVGRVKALAELPLLGREVSEHPGGGLRELLEGNYRIVYRVGEGVVEVLTVFEGHRLLCVDEIGEEPQE